MGSQDYKKAHVFTSSCSYFFVTQSLVSDIEAREMAQQVKTLSTTAEDSGFPMSSWGSSLQFQEIWHPLLAATGTCIHVVHIHPGTHTYNISFNILLGVKIFFTSFLQSSAGVKGSLLQERAELVGVCYGSDSENFPECEECFDCCSVFMGTDGPNKRCTELHG